ncbi:MAG: T9SS type A sorting domain-containing protein [Saprospiraceae bacterium]
MKRLVLPLLAALMWSCPASAAHIIGGYITYTANLTWPGNWDFEMAVYRDVLNGGALFDDPATFAMYRENTPGEYELVSKFTVSVTEITNISPTAPVCNPTGFNVQIERAIYRFPKNIPDDNFTYVIVYQRCCRNVLSSNLLTPNEYGFSLFAEMTPLARSLRNSSPKLDGLPPHVACNHEAAEIPFHASDPDGDVLTYAFCPILSGGGALLQPPALYSCEGALPDPPCPPPFAEVPFVSADYAFDKPLGINVFSQLDVASGIWAFQPDHVGSFNYAICVQDFRNGQLLGTIRHEFQLNITDDPLAVPETAATARLELRPNPARDFVQIRCADFVGQPARLAVSDIFGRTVLTKDIQPTDTESIDIQLFAPGFYTLKIGACGLAQSATFAVVR